MSKVERYGPTGWVEITPESLDGFAPISGRWKEFRKVATVYAVKMGVGFRVHTPEGVMTGNAGDYLCGPGAEGEYWPVKASIFESTYEEV